MSIFSSVLELCWQRFPPRFSCSLDLSSLKSDLTHDLWLDLEGGAGRIHVLLTISGLAQFDSVDGDSAAANEARRAASKKYGVSSIGERSKGCKLREIMRGSRNLSWYL